LESAAADERNDLDFVAFMHEGVRVPAALDDKTIELHGHYPSDECEILQEVFHRKRPRPHPWYAVEGDG
jgi:hypothetical protein